MNRIKRARLLLEILHVFLKKSFRWYLLPKLGYAPRCLHLCLLCAKQLFHNLWHLSDKIGLIVLGVAKRVRCLWPHSLWLVLRAGCIQIDTGAKLRVFTKKLSGCTITSRGVLLRPTIHICTIITNIDNLQWKSCCWLSAFELLFVFNYQQSLETELWFICMCRS